MRTGVGLRRAASLSELELADGLFIFEGVRQPEAVSQVMACLETVAALASDVGTLMDALPPLARVARYGNVRQTRAEQILPVINGLFERIKSFRADRDA